MREERGGEWECEGRAQGCEGGESEGWECEG